MFSSASRLSQIATPAEMVRGIKAYRLLTGYRGHPPADLEAFEETLLRVSRLVEQIPEISELDLNPIFAIAARPGLPDRGCKNTRQSCRSTLNEVLNRSSRETLPSRAISPHTTTSATNELPAIAAAEGGGGGDFTLVLSMLKSEVFFVLTPFFGM